MTKGKRPALRLWKFNQITGIWDYQRTVEPGTSDQWLAVFQRDEPKETFKVSRSTPKGRPS